MDFTKIQIIQLQEKNHFVQRKVLYLKCATWPESEGCEMELPRDPRNLPSFRLPDGNSSGEGFKVVN